MEMNKEQQTYLDAVRIKATEIYSLMYDQTPIRTNPQDIEKDKQTAIDCAIICTEQMLLANPKDHTFYLFLKHYLQTSITTSVLGKVSIEEVKEVVEEVKSEDNWFHKIIASAYNKKNR
jgi:hypothetical protein